MRIGSTSFDNAQLNAMAKLSSAVADDTTAISSGQRYVTPSDDPAAAGQSAAIGRTQANNAQATLGLDLAEQRLNLADSAMAGMSNALVRVKEIALHASNGTSSPADLQNYASEANQILGSMVTLGNAQDANGAYLFAGARAATPPFAQEAATGAVIYQGLGEAAPVAIGGTGTLPAVPSGQSVFGTVAGAVERSVFAVVQDFIAALKLPPAAASPTTPGSLPPPTAQQTAFAAAVDGATAATNRIADTRAEFGGKLNRIDTERDRLTAVGTQLTVARSALDDTDLAATITHLQQASTVLQATQKTFAQVSSLSLFNLLH